MKNLVITVSLEKMGSTEKEQTAATAEFLRTLADELETHGRFGTGSNPSYTDDATDPVAEYHLA